jgi:predicted RNA-binding protein
MCDIDAYLLRNGSEEKILENVERVEETRDGIRLQNIFGEEKLVKAKMVLYDSGAKKMVFADMQWGP